MLTLCSWPSPGPARRNLRQLLAPRQPLRAATAPCACRANNRSTPSLCQQPLLRHQNHSAKTRRIVCARALMPPAWSHTLSPARRLPVVCACGCRSCGSRSRHRWSTSPVVRPKSTKSFVTGPVCTWPTLQHTHTQSSLSLSLSLALSIAHTHTHTHTHKHTQTPHTLPLKLCLLLRSIQVGHAPRVGVRGHAYSTWGVAAMKLAARFKRPAASAGCVVQRVGGRGAC